MWPMKAPVEGYKTSFTVNKLWEGITDDQKVNVSVQLYQNGFEYGEPVTLSNPDYTYTWENLEAMDADGNPYIYTVDELTVLDGFTKTVDGGTITNTFKVKTIDITGTKVWIDGPDVKPVVTLQLLQDGVAYGDPVILDGTNTYTWTDLPETDSKGNPYSYTLAEVDVPENYEVSYSDDGWTVTNTYIASKIDIIGNKFWVGGPEPKPTITIELYRDGEKVAETIIENGDTTYTFTNLDKTDENGVEYV